MYIVKSETFSNYTNSSIFSEIMTIMLNSEENELNTQNMLI